MPNIGPLELAVVLIIALIVFGPKRVPELGRSMGKGIREFRSSISGKHDDDDEGPRLEEGSPASESVEGEVVGAHRP
jgi:sec-independent protein translocase protein TatA